MALNTVKNSFAPPSVCREFASGAARVLHDADAPAGCKHLPCGYIIESGTSLVWKDADGTTLTSTIPATALGLFFPVALAELDATNGCVVQVFWQRGTK